MSNPNNTHLSDSSKSERHLALEARVRETPLIERLVQSAEMIGKMCSQLRPPKMSIPVEHRDEDFFICITLNDAAAVISKPIPMLLFCPQCHHQHVDAPEPERGWTNPPHKSHLCHNCGTVWRPADVATVGIAVIATRGDADTYPSKPEEPKR